MHCVYSNFDTIKIALPWSKTEMPIFNNHAYFSVITLVLSDVNVRGGNVIKLPQKRY